MQGTRDWMRVLALTMGVAGFVHPGSELNAASLFWDTVSGNGSSITGGNGSWTNGQGNWNTGSGDTIWNSATPDDATFNGIAGTVTLGGDVTVGNITLNSGYTLADGGNTLTLLNSTITANTTTTISATLGGSTGLIKSGTGFLTLSGANTYTGVTTINSGVLSVTSLANGGSVSNIGASSNDAANLVLNGGTLRYAFGAGAPVSTDRLFSVGTSGGTLDASGGYNIIFSNTGSMGFNGQSGARTLTLTGSNANDNTLAAVIGDNGGATSVTKAGGGIWVLSGANTYTGVTTVSGTAVLKVSSLADGGVASNIGASSNAASNLVLNGGTFTYTGGAVSTDRLFSLGTSGITLNVFGTGGVTFTNTGNMGFVGTGTRTLTLANSNGGASTIAAVIGDNGGATSVTHTAGSSTWVLTGASTYTGATTINGGVISVTSLADGGSASNIGAASNAATNLVLNGGKLLYTGAGSSTDRLFSVGSSGGTLDSSGTGAVNFTNTGSMGFNSQTGARTLTLTGTNTGDNTIAAAIGDNTGATALTKAGTGTWVLTGANTYTGTTTISAGVLQIGNGGTSGTLGSGAVTDNANVTFNRSDTATVSNNISGSGTLTQAGTGTTILTGTNSYSGVTTISAGTLQIGNGGTTGTLGSGAIVNNGTLIIDRSNSITISGVMSGTGALIQNGTGTTTLSGLSNNWGSATVNAGILAAGVASGLGNSSAMIVNSGGTLATNGNPLGAAVGSLSGSGIVQNGSSNNSGLVVAGNVSSTFSGVLQNGGTGTLFLTKMGALSTLTLSGSSTYTGATTITGGTLSISTLANGGSASNIGASSNAASNLILNNPSAVLKYTGVAVSTDRLFSVGTSGGTLDASGTGAVNFTNTGSMGFNSQTGARTLTLTGTNTGSNTLAAMIGDNSGATALTKAGTGTWVLAGANTYTGVTTISGGVLQVGNGGTAGTLGSGAVTDNANLTFNRSDSVTVSNTISGSGSVTQAGTGTTTLSGTNSYTGVTRVSAGTLSVTSLANGGSSSNIGASSNAAGNLVLNGGTLQFNSATTTSTDRLFSVGTAGGTISLPVAGTLNFTNTGNIGFNGETGARTLTFAFSNSTFGGVIVLASGIGDNGGATSLVKANTYGTLRLTSDNNTYTGTTTINGALSIGTVGGSTGSIGTGEIIINAGGTLFVSRSGAVDLAQTISGAGGVTSNGNTMLTLSGTNTYTGVTRIISSGGVVTVSDIENGGVASSIGASSSAAGNLSITNLGTLRYVGTGASTDRLFEVPTGTANPVATIESSGSGALVFTNTGAMGFGSSIGARTLVLGGTNTLNNTMNPIIGDNSGATALTKAGTGTWVLAGANTYTGVTTISGGVLQVGNGGTAGTLGSGAVTDNANLTFNRSDSVTVSNTISGIGSVTQAGTGTTTLSGTNSYSGATTITAGTLSVTSLANGGSASNIGAASSLATNLVLNGGTLQYNGAAGSTNRLFSVGTDGGTLDSSGSGGITFTSALSMGFNGQSGARTLTLTGTNAFTTNQIAAGIGDSGGATSLVKSGSGTWAITGTNSYTGTTTINAGTLMVGANGTAGNLGTGNIINNGQLMLMRSNALTMGQNISGSGKLIQGAAGTVTLTGTNTYTGVTMIGGGGTLSISSLGNGGSASGIGAATNDAANIEFFSINATLKYTGAATSTDRLFSIDVGAGAVLDASGSGAINFTNTGAMGLTPGGASDRSLTLTGSNTGNNTLAAVIGESGVTTSVTKSGNGTWLLTGANTYTGATTIRGGKLVVSSLADGGSASNIGASSNAASNLVLNSATLQYIGGAVSTDRLFSIGTGSGTLDASGSGALNFTNTGAMGFNGQSGTRGLSLDGTGTGSIAAAIGDNGGATIVLLTGSATWTLSGASTYTGGTRIFGGVLVVSTLTDGGVTSPIGASSNAAANLWLSGGTLRYIGDAVSTDRLFTVGPTNSALDASGTGAVNFTNTGSLDMDGSGARIMTLKGSNTGDNTLSAVISNNGGATTLTKSGTGKWVIAGNNTYTGATNINGGTLQVGNGGTTGTLGTGTVNNSAALIVNRSDSLTIANTMGGTGTFTQAGTGTTTFSTGTKSYTGATFVNAGKLQAGGTYAFSTGSAVTIASGAYLELNGFTVFIGGLSGSGTVQNGTATGATLNVGGFANATFDGIMQDGGSAYLAFNKGGVGGMLTLTGANTYTGGTVVSSGILRVSSLANGGTTSNIGASSNQASNLILSGGTLQYTGAAVSTDRLFTVTTSGGTLDASGSGAVNFTNTGAMGFNSGSGSRALTLTGTNTGNNTVAAAIGDNGGATSLIKTGSGTWVLTGTNTYSGTTLINAGVLQVGNGSTTGTLGSGAVTNLASLVINRSNAITLANTISGSGKLTQAGAGTTTLGGSNSYTGVTTITSGVLNTTTLANGGSNSSIGASSSAATNLVLNGGTLQYTGSANVSTDRLFSLGIGGGVIDVSGTGTVNFTNTGSMGFNGQSGARTLVLSGTNTTGVNIIAAAIGDFGGATSVSIDGDATWLLTGANTYTGATTLSAGVLQIGGSNLASAIIVGSHATLELNGTDAKIGSLAGSGIVRNNSGTAATLTTGGNDTSTNFSGVIQDGGAGSLSLVKLGTGTLTLSGSNSYTGTTTISAGELQIGSGGTTGTLGTGAVINNAALTVNRSDAISIANNISGSGNFTQAGAGTTTLSGDNSYSGSTTINAGVLSVSVLANGGVNSNLGASSNAAGNLVLNGGTLQYTGAATSTDRLFSVGSSGGTLDASGTGAVNFTNTGSVDFNGQGGIRTLTLTGSNTDGNTLAAVIGDNGGATALTKSGSGTWVITAASTYTGATTISGGTLQIGNGGTTGSLATSSVINNNCTLAFNRSDSMTQGTDFASVIGGSGGVTQAGGGTLTLNGDNTYTGGTSIKSGTLEVTGNNALGTGDAGTTVSSGATLLLNNVNYSTSEALTLNGSGAGGGGALRNGGTSTYTGQITAGTNASINAGGGVLNLTGGLVKDGTVLTITGGGVVNVSGTGISGASASSDLVVDGTTLVVSADSDYNGPTTVQNAATLVANASVTTTQMNLSSDSMLAGTGAITTAMDQSIFINGTFSVGDPAVPATATSFALTTSGTGAVVLGAGSVVRLDLFSGAGLGSNLSNAGAADSINLHGRLDGSAGGLVVIGNPNGMTGFHGGDQWQLVKLNSGDANAGSITSELALNDSSLGLASGVTSYLDPSTGIFSIIDTNGGLALAAVEGQALISAGNTVTADLNGHLFNLRNGGGEEEDPGTLAASMDEGVIVGEGDGDPTKKDCPIAKRVPRTRQWEVFATVNYGNVRLSPIRTQSGVQVDSWASGVGVERHLTRGLKLGFAASFLQSTQGYTSNLGSLYLEGPALSTYLSYVRGGFWNSLLYSFGTYQMDTTRNPGAPFPTAYGSTRTYTHSVQYNTGWNFRFQNKTLVTGPFIGVDYLHGSVNAYSETGGGLAALHYSAQSYQSLVSRVGWSASKQIKTRFATITPQVRLSYERQNIRNNNGTSVSLINVPFTAVGGGQTPGQDYLVAGLGVSLAFNERFSLLLSYQGQFFRHDLQAHFGSIRFSYQF